MNVDLQGYRQKVGMSQTEVAHILDISKIQVNVYEQASETVPMGLLVKWLQNPNLAIDLLGVFYATLNLKLHVR